MLEETKNKIAVLLFGLSIFLCIQLFVHFLSIQKQILLSQTPRYLQNQRCDIPVGFGKIDILCLSKEKADALGLQMGDALSSLKTLQKQGRVEPQKWMALGICIHVNQATQEELEALPGVGPSLARKIIMARPFRSLSDLLGVSGIGFSLFSKIISFVCI